MLTKNQIKNYLSVKKEIQEICNKWAVAHSGSGYTALNINIYFFENGNNNVSFNIKHYDGVCLPQFNKYYSFPLNFLYKDTSEVEIHAKKVKEKESQDFLIQQDKVREIENDPRVLEYKNLVQQGEISFPLSHFSYTIL